MYSHRLIHRGVGSAIPLKHYQHSRTAGMIATRTGLRVHATPSDSSKTNADLIKQYAELQTKERKLQETSDNLEAERQRLEHMPHSQEFKTRFSALNKAYGVLYAENKAVQKQREILKHVAEAQKASRAKNSPKETSEFAGLNHASEAVVKSWKALQLATTKDGFLSLPEGTWFLASKQKGNCLMVRESYEKMANILDNLTKEGGINKIVITGSPGIGKSVFVTYFMWRLTQEENPPPVIILDLGPNDPKLCFFRDGSVLEAESMAAVRKYLHDESAWLIVDGCQPPLTATAKTLLVTSPDRSVWWPFHKECGATVLHMGPWDKAEIYKCWKKMYSASISSAELEALIYTWGDRPRYILEKAKDPSVKMYLDEALGCSDLIAVLRSGTSGGPGKGEQVSDRLLSMQPKHDFRSYFYAFSSRYIKDEVIRTLKERHSFELKLRCASATDSLWGREMLQEVKTALDGAYCMPSVRNEAAVDAIIQPTHAIALHQQKGAIRCA